MKKSTTRVLIEGGGVAALEAALALQELAPELTEVELVAPETEFLSIAILLCERTEGVSAAAPRRGRRRDATEGARDGRRPGRRSPLHGDGDELRSTSCCSRPARSGRRPSRRALLPRPGRGGRADADARGRARWRGRELRLRHPKRSQVGRPPLRAGVARRAHSSSTTLRRTSDYDRHSRGRAARAVRETASPADGRAARRPRHQLVHGTMSAPFAAGELSSPLEADPGGPCRWRCRGSKAALHGLSADPIGFLPTDPFGRCTRNRRLGGGRRDRLPDSSRVGSPPSRPTPAAIDRRRAGAPVEPSPFGRCCEASC